MKGSTANLVTQLNSTKKDPFVGVVLVRSSGSPMQDHFSFMLLNWLNFGKSYKNHKIANEDFLESLWVDLHSGVIIWYVLVESFWCVYLFLQSALKNPFKLSDAYLEL